MGVGTGVGLEGAAEPQAQKPKATSPQTGPRRTFMGIFYTTHTPAQELSCQSGRILPFDSLNGALGGGLGGVDLGLRSGEVQTAVSPEE